MWFFAPPRTAWAGALIGLLPLLAVADTATRQEESPRGAYLASQCLEASGCPLFDEVYAATPPFRHALALHLRSGDEAVPEWVKDKLPGYEGEAGAGDGSPVRSTAPLTSSASAMLPLRIDDRSYLLGRMTDPQDPRHRIVALYDTVRGSVTLHYVNKDGKAAFLGDTQEILRKVMNDYLDADSEFARSLARPDVALPVPVRSR